MDSHKPLVFKVATDDWEFDLIHQLNYKTFVEEIPQHQPSASRRLVDKFHAENTYLICLRGRQLVGMVAMRGNRPFSLDQKLPNLDSYLPPGRTLCEIRLLSVDKRFRSGQVLQGLLALIWQHGIEKGYDMAVISGTLRQQKLYGHLGFIPFGPVVGTPGAEFQPMCISIESFEAGARDFLSAKSSRNCSRPMANFLPGPVAVSRQVRRAFEQMPESHRSDSFLAEVQSTKQLLCQLTGARYVEILLGSGTLANDAIAGQLFLEKKPGLVLTNGEFGDRLVEHARRFGLDFQVVSAPWGKPFDFPALQREIEASPAPAWLWLAHCETSTGILNDLPAFQALCSAKKIKLCVDCISSIGTVPVNLDGVWLASAASGKGLRSYPGLGMVFYNHEISSAIKGLPRYLDLGFYASHNGVPFTHSSNLVNALQTAIKRVDWPRRFAELTETSQWLRSRLGELGFKIIHSESVSPAVVTIVLPPDLNSSKIGGQLHEAGYLISHHSEYLRRRNWVQICLMGEHTREKLVSLLNQLHRVCFRRAQTQATTRSVSPATVAGNGQ